LSNYPARYKLLFENSFEAMVIFDRNGIIFEINQHMAEMVGYSIDELIGMNVFDFMLPAEKSQAFDRAQKSGEGQKLPMVERTVIRKDGSTFIGEANLSPIHDDDGNLLYLLGILRDLTERKQLLKALKEKEAQLRQIGDNLPDGFIYRLVHTPDGKRFVSYMSEGVERMYDIALEEAMDDINVLYRMMLPEDLEAVILAEEQSIKTKERFDWEGRFRLHNGEVRWSRYHSKPTMLPDGTRIWDGVALDITEQKRAEGELQQSEVRIRALLDASIDIAFLTQPDGTIIDLNEAAAQAIQGSQKGLIGKNVLDFFPADISAARRSRSEQVIRFGKPVQFEDARGGKWFRNHIYPILDRDGKVDQLAIYAHDITDVQFRAAEDERIRIARELHDSVTQTMYSVSIVAEALPHLLETNLDEARRRAVHLRQMTLGALAELRNLLFEFHPKALQDTQLSILLRQLGEVLTGRTRIPVDLDIFGNANLPENVKIVFYRIAQEAFNNISKYAQATHVNVALESEPDKCKLLIKDNGIGFDLDSVYTEKMGLKIMLERAESIGADLTVISSPDQGTKVSLFWQPASLKK